MIKVTLACGCAYSLPVCLQGQLTLCANHAGPQAIVSQVQVSEDEATKDETSHYDFTWVNKATVNSDQIDDRTAAAIKIVAWAGGGGDWAAYLGPSDWSDQKVAEEGDKITRAAAESLFPAFKWSGRYYRGS